MKKILLLGFMFSLMGTTCWSSDSTPKIINDTEQEVTLFYKLQKEERSFKIKPEETLVFPNILKNSDFKGITFLKNSGVSVYKSSEELTSIIKNSKSNEFYLNDYFGN